MDFNPHNTASQFTTKLNEVIELEGEWEVGLLETSFPGKAENVGENTFYYSFRLTSGSAVQCTMRSGIYTSIQQVLAELRKIGRRGSTPTVIWDYSSTTKRVSFKFADNVNNIVSLWFSTDLAEMLGYDTDKQYVFQREYMVADRPIHLTSGFDNVYIYCDVLEHVLVGDTKTPLLRIVNRKAEVPKMRYNVEHATFNPVQYVPLQKRCFDTITIHMMTDSGEPMPFARGKSLVVLEFRRSVHPYLML